MVGTEEFVRGGDIFHRTACVRASLTQRNVGSARRTSYNDSPLVEIPAVLCERSVSGTRQVEGEIDVRRCGNWIIKWLASVKTVRACKRRSAKSDRRQEFFSIHCPLLFWIEWSVISRSKAIVRAASSDQAIAPPMRRLHFDDSMERRPDYENVRHLSYESLFLRPRELLRQQRNYSDLADRCRRYYRFVARLSYAAAPCAVEGIDWGIRLPYSLDTQACLFIPSGNFCIILTEKIWIRKRAWNRDLLEIV